MTDWLGGWIHGWKDGYRWMDDEKEEGREIDSDRQNGCVKISEWVVEWTRVKWETGWGSSLLPLLSLGLHLA